MANAEAHNALEPDTETLAELQAYSEAVKTRFAKAQQTRYECMKG